MGLPFLFNSSLPNLYSPNEDVILNEVRRRRMQSKDLRLLNPTVLQNKTNRRSFDSARLPSACPLF